MYKKICISNRHLVNGDFLEKLQDILQTDVDMVILREKDLSEDEYFSLADAALKLCRQYNKPCILHSFTAVSGRLKHPYIHLPLDKFALLNSSEISSYKLIGVSVHSLSEALYAEKAGASYITASPIFETACKPDVKPRGLSFLRDICSSVSIPVYALGGIHPDNIEECIAAGASGVCMMSEFMRLQK